MELRDWALGILTAESLDAKLHSPPQLTDQNPGPALIISEPSRPAGMHFNKRSKEEKLPPFHEHGDAEKRAVCLHRFCGHELLAVEIMAYVLLAFPEAPKHFRRGLANTLKEEQEHVRLYMQRLQEMGVAFGDLPLFKHFWAHTPFILSPKHYVSMMSLTFEQANLDFAPIYRKSFERSDDPASAALMERIFQDEISHVSFGVHWLGKFKKEDETLWESWEGTLKETLLSPKRARGFYMHEAPRLQAGIPPEWIALVKNA